MRPHMYISYMYFLSEDCFDAWTLERMCSSKCRAALDEHIFEKYEKWVTTSKKTFKEFLKQYKTGDFHERYVPKY